MNNKNRGYTLTELISVLFTLAFLIAITWVAIHFIAKFW